MLENISLSVISFILAALALTELIRFRQSRVAEWEHNYLYRRLKRRVVILGILEVIVIATLLSDFIPIIPTSPGWKFLFLLCALFMIFVVFTLILVDVLATIRYAARKHSEIALYSINKLRDDIGKNTETAKKDNITQ